MVDCSRSLEIISGRTSAAEYTSHVFLEDIRELVPAYARKRDRSSEKLGYAYTERWSFGSKDDDWRTSRNGEIDRELDVN
jgi:hypothetical protein